jgi:hypothetical protein
MTEYRRAARLQSARSLFMRRPSQVPVPDISRSTTEKEGTSTIAAFMLTILPVLAVVTKVTLGIARSARANRRNRPILRGAMILFFQSLNPGATLERHA